MILAFIVLLPLLISSLLANNLFHSFHHRIYLLTAFNHAVDSNVEHAVNLSIIVYLLMYTCKAWFRFDFDHFTGFFANTGSATDVMSKQVNIVVREINVSSPLAHCYSEIIEAFGFRSTMFPFVEACQQFTRSQDIK